MGKQKITGTSYLIYQNVKNKKFQPEVEKDFSTIFYLGLFIFKKLLMF